MTAPHRVEDELLDVVDEHDRVIGPEKRGLIHARRLRHRAVHVLVFNAQGQLFLQRRAPTKDTFPDRWDSSCSGHVDTGEDYLQSAVRELGEELGLPGVKPESLELLFKLDCCEQTGQEFVHVYRIRHDGPFVLHPTEISRGEFFEAMEITRQISENADDFAPAFALLWSRLQSACGLEPQG